MAIITVTAASDVSADDGETTLREAVSLANATAGADQIVFDEALIAGETTIRLTQGELVITDEVSIDGAGMITVTGDANSDDALVAGTDITDLAATPDTALADNTRVFRIDVDYTTATTFSGLTITGGRVDTSGLYGEEARPAGGGGIYATGSITLTEVTIAGNSVDGRFAPGGGLKGNTVTIHDSTISDNRTEGDDSSGGGVSAPTLTMTGSAVTGNSTLGRNSDGAGVIASFANISFSTFSANSANGAYTNGGGLSVGNGALSNITVSGNFAAAGGGLNAYRSNLENSVILGNASTTSKENDVSGFLYSLSNSIVGSGAYRNDSAISANPETVFAETELRNGVLSGVLGDNGGGVATIALRAANENPALDVASVTSVDETDQRGLPGRVDMPTIDNGGTGDLGAFELQAEEFTSEFSPVPPPPVSNAPTSGADIFFGGVAANTVFGRGGNDFLNGQRGADTINGGRGEDSLIGEDGADMLAGGSDNDVLIGGAGTDEMIGGRGDDLLEGGAGADRILGLAGDDTLRGGQGRDLLLGGLGDDMIQGATGNDRLFGGDGDDTISGEGGSASSARDTIVGGAGDDQLSGFGGGRTEFVFRDGDGSDDIFFFEQGIDKIRILRGAEEFEDLTITRDQDDVIIRFADVQITVNDQRRIDFDESDFLF